MYRARQSGKSLARHATSIAFSALSDVSEALPWLELGLFGLLVLGLMLI